jgi:Tfp pilus assembly protein PilF
MRFLVGMLLTAVMVIMIARAADAETLELGWLDGPVEGGGGGSGVPQPPDPKPSGPKSSDPKPSGAQSAIDRAREAKQRLCLNEHLAADQRLAVCSSLINAPTGDPKALVSIYIGRADAYVAKNDYGHAQADFDEAVRIDPSNSGSLNSRGHLFLQMKQYDRAIADFDQAIKVNPRDASPWFNRGRVHEAKRQIDSALQDYSSAIEINPGMVGAYIFRAIIFENKARYDFDAYLNEGSFEERAIADYGHIQQLLPQYVDAYNNRGSLYQSLRKYNLAIADFTQAIQLDPSQVMYIRNRAISYTSARRYELAIADYRAALKLNLDVATRSQIEGALKDLGATP